MQLPAIEFRRDFAPIAGLSVLPRYLTDLGVPFLPLIRLDVPSYHPDALPAELAAIPAIKPGSRAA